MGRQRGFTLVEVVVAFLLLSLVLVTVFELFTRGLSRAGELDNYSRALSIAQSEIASAGVEDALVEGEMRGESDDRQFHWVMSVRKYVEDPPPAQAAQPSQYALFRLEARVGWQGVTGAERDVTISTLVLAQNK